MGGRTEARGKATAASGRGQPQPFPLFFHTNHRRTRRRSDIICREVMQQRRIDESKKSNNDLDQSSHGCVSGSREVKSLLGGAPSSTSTPRRIVLSQLIPSSHDVRARTWPEGAADACWGGGTSSAPTHPRSPLAAPMMGGWVVVPAAAV